MPISKEEFEQAKHQRLIDSELIQYLYEHKDKAYSLVEILEIEECEPKNTTILDLAISGFVDSNTIGEEIYVAISQKGIEQFEESK